MSINIHPVNIFLYFGKLVCYSKAKRLCSLCAARCICYICSQTRRHNSKYKCRLARMLPELLFSRENLRLMSIVTIGNYLVLDGYFGDLFLKKSNGKS